MPTNIATDDKANPGRRDKAGTVLSVVTLVVLLVGVLVIRSTRSDYNAPPTPTPGPEQAGAANAATDPEPEVVIAWPSNRTKNR